MEGIEAAAMHRTGTGEAPGQRARLVGGAVGDHEFGGRLREQRAHRAAGGTAGAEQQHPRAGDPPAEVVQQVAHQPGSVRVVTVQLPVTGQPQRVHGAGLGGPAAQPVREREGIELEGNRDVHALAAGCEEFARGSGEAPQRHQQPPVFHVLPGLCSEAGMDHRRARMGNRVAGHHVAVGHDGGAPRTQTQSLGLR